MRINTNVMALNAQNKLTQNQSSVEKSIQRLSSGLRINGAADDASGLAISEKMKAQIRGLSQAQSNAQDGISLLQTAEGALQQTTDILQRMRELVIKAQNTGVLTTDDKTSIANELSTLRDEIDRIAESTTFNGKALLNGDMATQLAETGNSIDGLKKVDVANANANTEFKLSTTIGAAGTTVAGKLKLTVKDLETNETRNVYSDEVFDPAKTTVSGKVTFGDSGVSIDFGDDAVTLAAKTITTAKAGEKVRADFKIGANTFDEDVLSAGISDMSSVGLNRSMTEESFQIDISDAKAANNTLDAIDYALDRVSAQRASIGVIQNRMEYAVSNLSTTEENLTAAESRIRDVDMAEEMVAYTKNAILNQSAMSMLAQANQQPQNILSLLQ